MIKGKSNFVVSNLKEMWIKDSRQIHLHESYIHTHLVKANEIQKYNRVTVRELKKQSQLELEKNANYVDEKYKKYVKIICRRLNELHLAIHDEAFWEKALSLGFIRYITILHDAFTGFKNEFDPDKHSSNILDTGSYFTPADFEEHRDFFANTDLGREQLFSIYANNFIDTKLPKVGIDIKAAKEKGNKRHLTKLVKNTKNIIVGLMLFKRRIKVGVLGCNFSRQSYKKIIKRSFLKVYPIDTLLGSKIRSTKFNESMRVALSRFEDDFDSFDKFFFSSLMFCFPKIFIENFESISSRYIKILNELSGMTHIVAENWISNSYHSLFLAYSKRYSIVNICNEHNFISHPYAGKYISYIRNLCDIYVSLGWESEKYKGVKPYGSMYQFTCEKKLVQNHDILYVSSAPIVFQVHYSSSYGENGWNADSHLKFVKDFFKGLDVNTLQKVRYRPYPVNGNWLTYDKNFILSDVLAGIGSFGNHSVPSRVEMLSSKLVIVDYLATAYLESIIMNIPTIVFRNPNTYYLKSEFVDFFKPLLDANIMFDDPRDAALFVNKVSVNPIAWWSSDRVQLARADFLRSNIAANEELSNYLVGLTIQPSLQ